MHKFRVATVADAFKRAHQIQIILSRKSIQIETIEMYRLKIWMWFFFPFDCICWVIWLAVIFFFFWAATLFSIRLGWLLEEQVLTTQHNIDWSSDRDTFRTYIRKGFNRNDMKSTDKIEEEEENEEWAMNNWLMWQRHFNGCNKSTGRHLIIFLPSFKSQNDGRSHFTI